MTAHGGWRRCVAKSFVRKALRDLQRLSFATDPAPPKRIVLPAMPLRCSRTGSRFPAQAVVPRVLLSALVVAFVTAMLLVVAPATLAAQQPATSSTESATEEVPPSEVAAGFEAGTGRLRFAGGESGLPYSLTLTGDLFALTPLLQRLGGELSIGPLGQSHHIDLYDTEIILGPDSPVMTVDEEIVPLSRAPLKTPTDLMVPIDFLRRTWGDLAGYSFTWSRTGRTLLVERRPSRDLAIELDLVNIARVSTLVLRFTEDPAHRFERTATGFEVVFPGDRLELRGPLPRPVDMIEQLALEEDRLVVDLSPDAEAADPYRVDRQRIQLLIDIARGTVRRGTSARSTGTSRPPLGGERDSGEMRIVLDPGHGGDEVGAVGTRGTLEKDLTLSLARRLQRGLEARLPVRVLMTRERDVTVPHETRTAIANQNNADLFISLHMNSVPGGGGQGAETYFLSLEASDRQAAESARIENLGGSGEDDLSLMLWDLAQSRHMAASQAFGRLVQRELNQTLELRDRGVKQAPFRVLIGATMPAVLIEFGFLSNPEEEAKLQRADYQDQLVGAVVRAVEAYRAARRAAGAPADPASSGEPR